MTEPVANKSFTFIVANCFSSFDPTDELFAMCLILSALGVTFNIFRNAKSYLVIRKQQF